jgi:glycosyltransferase involved in cell wall biosynthesis
MHIVMVGPFGLQPRMTMGKRALPLGQALVRRGHSVTLLLPPWQNPEDAGRVWEEGGVHIENVVLPRGIPGWFQARLTGRLVRRTRQLDPDVVHTFKPKAYAGLAHMALARRYPIVVDTDDWEGPGGWNALGDYNEGLQRFFTWQERWGLTHAGAVTVASRALQTLAWSMGGAPERVVYLPNGVAPVQTEVQPPGERRPTVLLYTRFFEFGLERLWRILQRVHACRPEVRVLVVGKGFAGEEEWLLQAARDAGWDVAETHIGAPSPSLLPLAGLPWAILPWAGLVYAGFGTPESLPACFAAADVALYPFDDTLLNRTKCPVKLLELLAAGIPVVGDAVGQIAEVVAEGITGHLVRPGADEAFADAVLDLLSDPDRLARMRSAARADMAARYAWDHLAGAAEMAYTYAVEAAK